MKKAVIYGMGGTGSKIYDMIKDDMEVVAFTDSDPQKTGGGGQTFDSCKESSMVN